MPFRSGHIPSTEDLLGSADITPSDIADAKRSSKQRAPRMQPAFDAVLIDPELDPGPLPDPDVE